MKLLIVDDDAMIREVLKLTLATSKDKVIECSDGDEAVFAYDKHRPDWVLMDVSMARMDGLTATAKIREKYPNANIIILTSHSQVEFEDASKKVGAAKFVYKDNFEELRKLIKR